jgi:Uma2 family endonuclease
MSTALRKSIPTVVVNGALRPDVLLHVPADAHTLDGFRRWVLSDEFPEKLRVMFLDGEIYIDMSTEEIRSHAAVKAEVALVILGLNRKLDLGNIYINGVLVTNKQAKVSNNPDIVAVFWNSLEQKRVEYVTRNDKELEIVGSPDWLLEIVSDSSVFKDKTQLREAYHRAGVREYWIIDARGDDLNFELLYWQPAGYVAAETQKGWVQSRAFKRRFRLTRKKDRRGAWKYTLAVK